MSIGQLNYKGFILSRFKFQDILHDGAQLKTQAQTNTLDFTFVLHLTLLW